MAGRGCTIKVQVTKMNGDETIVQDLYLPVALHSPLHVLREHLHELTGIVSAAQVLILCDLTDPDRNRDVLLAGRDYESLFECGIREDSFLTLHPIGIVRPSQLQRETSTIQIEDESDVYAISTPITPAQSDHSYNGVVFDIESRDIYETEIISFSFGGMLGRVRIFARDRGWEPVVDDSYTWRSVGLAMEGWECVADLMCPPSWDRASEIRLRVPVTILPHARRAFYLHSSLPDDLGIQYQSFRERDIIYEDDRIRVHPGLGHTGSEPFDDVHGWYRAYRGLAGGIKYRAKRKHWTIHDHLLFPIELREAVFATLLCRQRSENVYFDQGISRQVSETQQDTNTSLQQHASPSTPNFSSQMDTISHRHDFSLLDYESQERQFFDEAIDQQITIISEENMPARLISLPLHVVYYILEFMHWDWFLEARVRQYELNDLMYGRSGNQSTQERPQRRRSLSGNFRFTSNIEPTSRTSTLGFNPLQVLGGFLTTSGRMLNIHDVIESILRGGNPEALTLFGNSGSDDDDDDEDGEDDYEDSKEDIDSHMMMETYEPGVGEEDEEGDGYEHKSAKEYRNEDRDEDKGNDDDDDDDEDGELTSNIYLRGLGGNTSDGDNI